MMTHNGGTGVLLMKALYLGQTFLCWDHDLQMNGHVYFRFPIIVVQSALYLGGISLVRCGGIYIWVSHIPHVIEMWFAIFIL